MMLTLTHEQVGERKIREAWGDLSMQWLRVPDVTGLQLISVSSGLECVSMGIPEVRPGRGPEHPPAADGTRST